MNFATTTKERSVSMQTQVPAARVHPEQQTIPRHRDASPLLSLGVLLGSIAMLCGVVMFTTHFENGQQGKTHSVLKAAPPIFIHH